MANNEIPLYEGFDRLIRPADTLEAILGNPPERGDLIGYGVIAAENFVLALEASNILAAVSRDAWASGHHLWVSVGAMGGAMRVGPSGLEGSKAKEELLRPWITPIPDMFEAYYPVVRDWAGPVDALIARPDMLRGLTSLQLSPNVIAMACFSVDPLRRATRYTFLVTDFAYGGGNVPFDQSSLVPLSVYHDHIWEPNRGWRFHPSMGYDVLINPQRLLPVLAEGELGRGRSYLEFPQTREKFCWDTSPNGSLEGYNWVPQGLVMCNY